MSNKPQSYASHAKIDPAFHFFVLPGLLINIFVVGLSSVSSSRNWWRMGAAGFAALLVLAGRLRSWATHLQDRVIRVEERIRLTAILPEPLRSRYRRTVGFSNRWTALCLRRGTSCSFPARLDEKLSRSDIKKAITDWRPDYSRV